MSELPTMPAAADQQAACGRPKRRLAPGAQRPADLLAAFFMAALSFFVAGGAVAVLTALDVLGWYGHWLALHLVLVGGVSQLILGAGQFFSTAYLATEPPTRKMVHAQLTVWNCGAVLLAIGVPTNMPIVTDFGGLLIITGLMLFATSLRQLEGRSLQTARWTIRWYYACAASLSVGALIGVAMARGTVWTHGSLLGAHLALNIAGWLGTAIIGTLHTFYPSLTHSMLKHPRLQGPTFIGWTTGFVTLAVGEAFAIEVLDVCGWIALTGAAILLSINIVGSARAAEDPVSLAGRLVGGAQLFLPAGLLTALAMIAVDGAGAALTGPWRAALGVLLAGGWIGMTVAGSMLHLLTVLNRVRNFFNKMPEPSPPRDAIVCALLMTSIAALALSKTPALSALGRPATIAVLLTAAPVVGQIVVLAVKALGPRVKAAVL